MLIILDGADCAGKSTLAQQLSEALTQHRGTRPIVDVDVYHKGPPTAHPLDEYAAPLLTYRLVDERHIICDRWHVGEAVYPAVLDRPTQLDAAVNAWLELFLLSRGALLVHARRSASRLQECGRDRNDPAAEIDRAPIVAARFDRAMASTLLPLIIMDENGASPDDVDDVIQGAEALAAQAYGLSDYVTYVGSPHPTLLLVGDRRGVSYAPTRYGRWPAFAPFPGTSGHYLFSALTREPLRAATHGVLLAQIGVVNANDVDDVRACWEALGKPRVVALGVEARKTLRRVGVDVDHYVPHPQYWARFRHHEPDVYLQRIMGIQEVVGA